MVAKSKTSNLTAGIGLADSLAYPGVGMHTAWRVGAPLAHVVFRIDDCSLAICVIPGLYIVR